MDSNQLPVKFLKLTFIQLNYIDCVLLQVILSGDEDVIFFFFFIQLTASVAGSTFRLES